MQKSSLPSTTFDAPAIELLVGAVSDLSMARSLEEIVITVRTAARKLISSDGTSFILREGDLCHYADEDAIAPLWKGQRFPREQCVSGWAMEHRQHVVIADIHKDHRIPIAVYRPTFVKSLVIVPIRKAAPIAAIGGYWSRPHEATATEVWLLQALADSTAVAMAHVELLASLERRVAERTQELELANRDLSAFASSLTHDLRGRLFTVDACARLISRESSRIDAPAIAAHAGSIREAVKGMGKQIDSTLSLYSLSRKEAHLEEIDLSALARQVADQLSKQGTQRKQVSFLACDGLLVRGDAALLQTLLENLIGNAWKYSSKREDAKIEFGVRTEGDGTRVFYVRDNGAGFDMSATAELFNPFVRLHTAKEFAGHGVGLASAQRIVQKHGGRIWAESARDKGATFYFTLPPPRDRNWVQSD